jgi:hypothetical protein
MQLKLHTKNKHTLLCRLFQPAQASFVRFVAAISIAGSIFPEGKRHRSIRFDSFFSR